MIVYLGMPKCASTWLYDKIHIILNTMELKNPHPVEYGKTNNDYIDSVLIIGVWIVRLP